jgi:hypothetical protein
MIIYCLTPKKFIHKSYSQNIQDISKSFIFTLIVFFANTYVLNYENIWLYPAVMCAFNSTSNYFPGKKRTTFT